MMDNLDKENEGIIIKIMRKKYTRQLKKELKF